MRLAQVGRWLVILVFACSLKAQDGSPPHYTGESPRAFVEAFYTWYVPRAIAESSAADRLANLRAIRSDLSSQLGGLLEGDYAAQSRCRDMIGIDFDPFLNTQDPNFHYEVGAISRVGARYRAEIFRLVGGRRLEKPDLVAEFIHKGEHWLFVNFYYPEGDDLLKLLKIKEPCRRPRERGERGQPERR
jgi:hypothetical protein